MKKSAVFVMAVGFIPAFATAIRTESLLQFVDYACAVISFCVAGIINEIGE